MESNEYTASRDTGRKLGRAGTAIIIILVAVVLVFIGQRFFWKFEEPPVVDVSDILRGNVDTDIVLVRGIVQREGREQGYIFLGDVEEESELVVDGVSMLPVVRVQSWGWFQADQELRLPVRITADSSGNLLLVEVRGRGGGGCRRLTGEDSVSAVGDSSAGADTSQDSR